MESGREATLSSLGPEQSFEKRNWFLCPISEDVAKKISEVKKVNLGRGFQQLGG